MKIIEIPDAPGGPSHIAYRLDVPARPLTGAPTVLYLHGFGSSQDGEKATYFRACTGALGMSFCSLDFQGHGASGGTLRDLSLTRNLEDLGRVRELLEAQGHRRFILFGSSLGGLTGLWTAALDSTPYDAGLFIAPALDLADRAKTWFGPEGLERWRRDGKVEIQTEVTTTELGWGFIEDLESYSGERLRAEYRTPSLVLQGKNDDSVSWRAVTDFVTECGFQGLDLHLFADGDHRLLDRKERLWTLMTEFLRGRGLL